MRKETLAVGGSLIVGGSLLAGLSSSSSSPYTEFKLPQANVGAECSAQPIPLPHIADTTHGNLITPVGVLKDGTYGFTGTANATPIARAKEETDKAVAANTPALATISVVEGSQLGITPVDELSDIQKKIDAFKANPSLRKQVCISILNLINSHGVIREWQSQNDVLELYPTVNKDHTFNSVGSTSKPNTHQITPFGEC